MRRRGTGEQQVHVGCMTARVRERVEDLRDSLIRRQTSEAAEQRYVGGKAETLANFGARSCALVGVHELPVSKPDGLDECAR